MRWTKISAVLLCFWVISIDAVAQEPSQSPRDSVWTHREVFYPKTGKAAEKNIRQRWVRADGAWKEVIAVQKSSGIQESIAWSNVPADIPGHQNKFIPLNPKLLSPDFLRSSPEFVREDEVLGYKAYVWRSGQGENWTEQWYAPAVSHLPIKIVMNSPVGQTIVEPISIEFRTVTEADLATSHPPKKQPK
jgi:hypothetical protein